MAGIKYIKNASTVDLTGSEYTGISNQRSHTLFVRTGANANATIKYGFTTDVSASEYSPKIKLNNSVVYIASQYSFSTQETTGTSYHTKTESGTIATTSSRSSTYTSRTEYKTKETTTSTATEYLTSSAESAQTNTNISTTSSKSSTVQNPSLSTSLTAYVVQGAIDLAKQKVRQTVNEITRSTLSTASRGNVGWGAVLTAYATATASITAYGYKTTPYWYYTSDLSHTGITFTTQTTNTVYHTTTRSSQYNYTNSYTNTSTTRTEYLTSSTEITSNNCNI